MARERARFRAGLLLGCAACGSYNHPREAESAGEVIAATALTRSSEASESEAWDTALDDARDAWSRSSASGSRVAIRFEAQTPSQHAFSANPDGQSIRARAFVDGRTVDALSPPLLGNGSQLIAVEALDGGRHSLRASFESSGGRVLVEKTISFEVDDSHDVLVRAIVSSQVGLSSSWQLDVASLAARRMSTSERADQDVERIDAVIRSVRLDLADQRSSLDPRSTHCMNDGLSQMFVAKRACDELHSDLSAALSSEPERAPEIASRITLQRRRVGKLARESRSCAVPTSSSIAMMVPTGR